MDSLYIVAKRWQQFCQLPTPDVGIIAGIKGCVYVRKILRDIVLFSSGNGSLFSNDMFMQEVVKERLLVSVDIS